MRYINDINNTEELIQFLKQKGNNHNNYYHYTTWDSLEKIMKYGTFLLTRGNSLNINDQHEAIMKGSWQEWNKTYIGSFAFGESENMAMWGLYGLPWEDAVRISISKTAMNQWIESIDHVEVWRNNRVVGQVQNAEIALNDVVYVSGQSGSSDLRLTHAGKHSSTSNKRALWGVDRAPQMTGYIKHFAWSYENEVRLRIHVPHDVGSEKILVHIPPEVLDTFSVTTGPSFTWRNSALYDKLSDNGKLNESTFLHLVKYKSLCSMCQHESFEPKPTP